MDNEKRRLELDRMPLVGVESHRFEFEVYAGRWLGGGKRMEWCAVIVQRRRKGPCGKETVFKMAIDSSAVATVCEGLERWMDDHEHVVVRLPQL